MRKVIFEETIRLDRNYTATRKATFGKGTIRTALLIEGPRSGIEEFGCAFSLPELEKLLRAARQASLDEIKNETEGKS